jgi:hypothetical protein
MTDCEHKDTRTYWTGGYTFSFGAVDDDVCEHVVCDDCGEHVDCDSICEEMNADKSIEKMAR